MTALTSPYLWYTSRSTGLVALVLFTIVVILGTLVATRIGGSIVGRFELNELHRSLSMVAVIFLVIHIATTVFDSYVSTGVLSAFLPFVSKYRPVQVAIGTIAFDLTLAVWVSSLLKARMDNTAWRAIHWFSWPAFAAALVHGLLTGTDTRHHWAFYLVIGCAVAGAASGVWRIWGRPTRAGGRTALSPLAPAAPPRATKPPHSKGGRR